MYNKLNKFYIFSVSSMTLISLTLLMEVALVMKCVMNACQKATK